MGCIYDKEVEGADKTEYLFQVSNSAIFIFQVKGHKNNTGIGSACMNPESYDHCTRLRQLQRKSPR